MDDFAYLAAGEAYFDAACQSLRPQPVLDALQEYYTRFNSCGERVKYAWGRQTDERVAATRAKLLKHLKLSPREYLAAFTLNTTYGINLLLSELRPGQFRKIITSNFEHNSPFLATMAAAERLAIPREVVEREADGTIDPSKTDWQQAIVVVGVVSNVDGSELANLQALVKAVHKAGGIILLDAAQALAHHADLLAKTEADAILASAHKMYAPSLGVMVVRKDLLPRLVELPGWLGGGMVDDVTRDDYQLSYTSDEHIASRFEAGLQAAGEIVALGAALDWLDRQDTKPLQRQAVRLFDFLAAEPRVRLFNRAASPVISFSVEGLDSHLLGTALSHEGIMARTGYFCNHYYLAHQQSLPPLIRLSLGLHNREADLAQFETAMRKVLG